VSDAASAQQQQRNQVRRAATVPPERTNATPDTPIPALPSPETDKTSALGQALAACKQGNEVQEALTLPGLKGEITLDRCYKGRSHLVCVFTALSSEARSLTLNYGKIVAANYPEINTVDGICKLNPETLASSIVGSEDFAKRFKELQAQYAAATSCASTVEQS